MEIKYLGTAAAEGIPALFCQCKACKNAREKGGKEIRTRSQALIDGKILMDFPCDTYYHTVKNGVDMAAVKACLITHVHGDHLYTGDFGQIHVPFTNVPPESYEGFHIYGSIDVKDRVEGVAQNPDGRFCYHHVLPFEPFFVDGFKITALKAKHGTPNPYIYMIERGSKTLLYAHDTDIPRTETMEYLKGCGRVFDVVSMDCTEGAHDDLPYHGHMCLGRNIALREQMLQMGVADSHTVFVLNHFSHNGLSVDYQSFCEIAEPLGFVVSYDGMTVTC